MATAPDSPAAPEMLSRHFSRAAFEKSQAASRLGLKNRMNAGQLANAKALCRAVLEPLRAVVGPLAVNSGYRSPLVNDEVGGSDTSDHLHGRAADVETALLPGQGGLSTRELFDVARLLRLPFDQLILEFPGKDPRAGWVHLGYREAGGRGQTIKAPGYRAVREAPVHTDNVSALVRAFQRRVGLDPDGLIGPDTRDAARAAAAAVPR
jgi:zinc D-Ala-D-Ala carboxypeptidase